jgi:hypothetical protein
MATSPRARSDVDAIDVDLTLALQTVREALKPVDGTPEDHALCAIETFCAVSLRVMRKTNPSKLRSEARTVEIGARLAGLPVLEVTK